jgi:hypothetical protein
MLVFEMQNPHIGYVQSEIEDYLRRAAPLNLSILCAIPNRPGQIDAEDCTQSRNSPCRPLPGDLSDIFSRS